ncbi:hypothetical protein ACVWW1_007275 [Bradyrhizobium sp. JR3.5]
MSAYSPEADIGPLAFMSTRPNDSEDDALLSRSWRAGVGGSAANAIVERAPPAALRTTLRVARGASA